MRKQLLAGAAAVALLGASSVQSSAQQPPLMNWSGFYVGGFAGWGQANFVGHWVDTSDNVLFPWRTRPSGFLAGVHTGQNWQNNTFVMGWEADVAGTFGWDETVNGLLSPSQSVTTKVSLLASLRARLGVLLDPSLFVYLTGGVGYQRASVDAVWIGNGSASAKLSDFGPVVGGGVEWKQTQNLSWRLQALWYFFNDSVDLTVASNNYVHAKMKETVTVTFGGTLHY